MDQPQHPGHEAEAKFSYRDDGEFEDNREALEEAHRIGIATATLYRNWGPGEPGDNPSIDKVRGDLALETMRQAIANGNQIVVVDGGSSEAFLQAAVETGAHIQPEHERGMSAGRRQALDAVSHLNDVDVVCWTEPEKISMVRDCLAIAARPILDGEADIVVPSRDEAAFATYPDYQADFERESDHLWNNKLRQHGLLPQDAPDLDAWVGPRIFRNDPDILALFRERTRFMSEVVAKVDQSAPELWPDALFLPLVTALHEGYRVQSVPVPYRHPASQTAQETANDLPAFKEKRAKQQRDILVTTIHFIHMLKEHEGSRLERF